MRYFEILLEAQDYDGMFRPFLHLLPGTQGSEPLPRPLADFYRMARIPSVGLVQHNTYKETLPVIADARKFLKKNDRIVWFLRLYRIGYLQSLWRVLYVAIQDTSGQHIYNKEAIEVKKWLDYYQGLYRRGTAQPKVNLPPNHVHGGPHVAKTVDIFRQPYPMLQRLEHYFSLPIPEIQNHVFGYDNPDTILKTFSEYEKKWQKSRQGLIHREGAEQGAKVILQFPNGLAWWLLDRAACPLEAEAMGHCGNEPRAGSDDRIISLRRQIRKGKQIFYEPYATFILQKDGTLGEMKGKFNESPKNAFKHGYTTSDFNAEIVALLKLPMIKGITGGGYMPQNNFKVADLSPEQIDDLGNSKPHMLPLAIQYKRHGVTPDLIKSIDRHLNEAGESRKFDKKNQAFVWDTDKNLESFIESHIKYNSRERRSAHALWVLSVLEDGSTLVDHDYGPVSNYDKQDLLNDLEKKDRKLYNRLDNHVMKLWKQANPDEEDEPDLLKMMDEVADELSGIVGWCVEDGRRYGAEAEMSKSFHNWLDELKAPGGFWITLPEWDEKYYDSKVILLCDIPTVIDLIDNDNLQVPDELTELEKFNDLDAPYHDYSGYDEVAALEILIDKISDELPKPKTRKVNN